MELEKVIIKIQEIKGYIGSTILNKTGEIIYIDEDKTVDLAFSSSLFNDTFRALTEASLDIGLSNLTRLEAQTEEGDVFLIYANQKHTIFAIFELNGNVSLAKMILSQALKSE